MSDENKNIEEQEENILNPQNEEVFKNEETEKTPAAENIVEEATKATEEENEDDNGTDEEEVTSSDEEEQEEGVTSNEKVDYTTLNKTQLIEALSNLIESSPVQKIKDDVEEIKNEFNSIFQEELAAQKETFIAEGGNVIDFYYESKDKKEFNTVYNAYRDKKNAYYKKLKNDLEANLANRTNLIEELKALLDNEKSVHNNYKDLKNIQDRWKEAGPIPRDKYNTVWNNYHHHIETYYDALHRDREFRDLDFQKNLEKKQKLIKRTEELAEESNVEKAFKELQLIHRKWKEEIGPVAREFRDEVWDKFSAATKIIHDKKQEAEAALEEKFNENFSIKKELIGLIDKVKEETKDSHGAWQKAMDQVQEIRDVFFSAGRVPKEKNKEIWASFKETTKNFNQAKNDFYKSQKNQQFENLEKKKALIEIAEANKDSEDFENATNLFKKIQSDWKNIGHVPRKDSDKIWKQFKAACNHYFDRLSSIKEDAQKGEMENFEKKEAFLKVLDNLELSGDHKEDISTIKSKITEWKTLGRVPFKKKNIEQQFNKKLDELFGKLDLGKKETELIKFENKLNAMASMNDSRQLQNEEFFIRKKIDETRAEINQLENNLGFFQHVPDDNPMVKDVYKNIERHKEQLSLWQEKLNKIKTLKRQQAKAEEE
ncbi:DUF349 domain-containing protein [Patiriisocius marinus]|uniref:DUF349 domain-containing protein n=1 Tax=Patiriisocius marinus TaxID=1397112 RepID=A0A5J4J3D5_9FLAO|nr:DUF349 domain-containing protein [Patiriisocius marinus]GER58967.1 hypothetical protein ULMA_10750 [Patiriisocius marinus]